MIEVLASKHSVFLFVNHWDQFKYKKNVLLRTLGASDWETGWTQGVQCSGQDNNRTLWQNQLAKPQAAWWQSSLRHCVVGACYAPATPVSAATPEGSPCPFWAVPIPYLQFRNVLPIDHYCSPWLQWKLESDLVCLVTWWTLLLLQTYIIEHPLIIGKEFR